MHRSVIIGNGINIQFDKCKDYTSKAIMNRVVNNLKAEKYQFLWNDEVKPEEVLGIIDALCKIIDDIVDGKYKNEVTEISGVLGITGEYKSVQEYYKDYVPNSYETVQLEDFLFAFELLNHIQSVAYHDTSDAEEERRKGISNTLRMMIVDGIYNEGQINKIYKEFPLGLKTFLSGYERIFTINYDLNLDTFLEGTEINHLHGAFNVPSPKYTTEFLNAGNTQHMYCNAVMSWSWLDKYASYLSDDLKKDTSQLQDIEGQLDIIGISPRNDEQIFIELNMNPNIKSVNYYYKEGKGISSGSVSSDVKRNLSKPCTVKSVDKLWRRFNK